jgi:hypothetical protein
MSIRVIVCLLFCSAVFYSCSNTPAPTGPQIPHPGLVLSLVGYGITLDSTYYKVWSDSSWQEFYSDTTIGGTRYSVILDDGANRYYYGPGGYAGFWLYGDTLTLFDSSLASLPDTVAEGTTYSAQTTFMYRGTSNVMTDQETVLDTASVVTPFGTFTNCRVIQSAVYIDGVLQYVTDYWLAKGPSDVVREYDTGYTIVMAYGEVNGLGWGVNASGSLPAAERRASSAARAFPSSESGHAAPDMSSLAPGIARGILR